VFAALKLRFNNRLFRPAIEQGPITLTQRRIFILPTRQGLAMAGVLLLMLLGDINYNLSLGYILTFLLATMAISSMLHTFRNLAYLEIRAGRPNPVFQGDMARFPLHLHSKLPRYQLMLKGEREIRFDLPANQTTEIGYFRHTENRGWLESGKITIYTEFPLGLFRAWSYLHFDVRCLVYPRPMADAKLSEQTSSVVRGDEDFSGLRTYVRGDTMPRIAWKAYARDRGLLVKQFSGRDDELWLDMKDARDTSIEEKLSRMTAWVLEAESKGLRYGLRLMDDEIKPGHDAMHRESCLAMLALFGIQE
jgi:uncharacterized protein (DUF58 family)